MEKHKKTEKVELGKCPYCNSTEYIRNTRGTEGNFVSMDCFCNDCDRWFVEYFGLDEVKFDKDGEEFILNNALTEDEKKILKDALNVFIDCNNDVDDCSRIFKVLNGGLNEE